MNDKWWLDSQTVRGALLTIIPTITLILKLTGIEVGNDEMTTLVEAVASIAGMVGVLMAIAGRFKANRSIAFQKENK